MSITPPSPSARQPGPHGHTLHAATGDGLAELTTVLRAFVRRRVRDPEAAADIVQDVLLKLTRERASGSGPRRVAGWLFRAAHNAIVDWYRQRSAAFEELDADEAAAAEPSDDDIGRLRTAFRTFVHALPPLHREALLLTEYEGLSQRQLAERLGVPLSTAKSRVQRARGKLGQALHDCCTFEFDRRGGVIDCQPRSGTDAGCC